MSEPIKMYCKNCKSVRDSLQELPKRIEFLIISFRCLKCDGIGEWRRNDEPTKKHSESKEKAKKKETGS